MQESFQNLLNYVGTQTLQNFSYLLPKVLGALFTLIIGILIAKLAKNAIQKLLSALNFSKLINKTPLQFAFGGNNLGVKLETAIANVFYWLTILVIVHTSVNILNLSSLTRLLDTIFGYIPNVISALFILLFGIFIGGWVESFVKNTAKTADKKSARVMGKAGGYVVLVLTVMTALSELGIADEFINMIFVGFIATISLGAGLAIGLGGKNTVEKILGSWYENKIGSTQDSKNKAVKKRK